jgi:hypothetical protein
MIVLIIEFWVLVYDLGGVLSMLNNYPSSSLLYCANQNKDFRLQFSLVASVLEA